MLSIDLSLMFDISIADRTCSLSTWTENDSNAIIAASLSTFSTFDVLILFQSVLSPSDTKVNTGIIRNWLCLVLLLLLFVCFFVFVFVFLFFRGIKEL